jgi:uncharacterized protein YjdB
MSRPRCLAPVFAALVALALFAVACSGGDEGPVAVTGVTLDKGTMSLTAGGAPGNLTATIAPANATNQGVTWTSSAPAVAAVAGSGLGATVTPLSPGAATITAKSAADPTKAATCDVTVSGAAAYPMVFLAGGYGLYRDGMKDGGVGPLFDVFVDATGNVHAAGCHQDPVRGYQAAYYLNGALTLLPLSHPDTDYISKAHSIEMAPNGDLYVAGYEAFYEGPYDVCDAARLWKKPAGGQWGIVPLGGVDETGNVFTLARRVRIHDGDVWVGGVIYDDYPYPCFWRNGAMRVIDNHEDGMEIYNFDFASDGKIYAIFSQAWFQGPSWDFENALAAFSDPDDLDNWEYRFGGDSYSVPCHLFIDGADVYVAGRYDVDACYWKNGVRAPLPAPAGSLGAAGAEAIFVHGGRVYIAGASEYPDYAYRITQWIDGAVVVDYRTVAEPIDYRTEGMFVQQVTRVPVASIGLDSQTLTIPVGYAGALGATVSPANATIKGATWTTSDAAVATIAGNGLAVTINGLAPGTARITAASPDGPAAHCDVTVQTVAATGVAVNPAGINMALDRTTTLLASMTPATATNKAVAWTTSNPSVATVAGSGLIGVVSGVALGNATITVTTQDGGHQAVCAVSVVPVGMSNEPVLFVAGPFGLYVDGRLDANIGAQGEERIYDIFVDVDGHVHAVGGHHGDGELNYWLPAYFRDDVRITLPTAYPDPVNATLYGIDIANGNAYMVGHELDWQNNHQAARLWTGGAGGSAFTQSPLQGVSPTGVSTARAVRVRGGNVYVAGGEYGSGWSAVIWKDNAKHAFPTIRDAFIDIGVTADGRIYALGAIDSRLYLISPDLGAATPVALAGLDAGNAPLHMFVDGNDVYLSGWHDQEACYWKNGTRHDVEHPPVATWLEAQDIHVLDGHLYMVGTALVSSEYRIFTWIDGIWIDDDRAILGTFDYEDRTPAAIFAARMDKSPASAINLSQGALTIPVGYADTLTASIAPPNAFDKAVVWSSDSPAVAAVAGAGLAATINGLTAGQAVITAALTDGPSATCTVTVQTVAVAGVALPPTLTVGAGRTATLTASIQPPTATNKNIDWEASNGNVAVTGSGTTANVMGVAVGSSVITATTQDGGHQATCTVTVAQPDEPAVYVAGWFGLYIDGQRNEAIGLQMLEDVAVDDAANVYAVGRRPAGQVEYEAVCYRNGEPTALQMTHPLTDLRSSADGVFVSGDSVYAAGFEDFMEGPWDEGGHAARLWKNGLQEPLEGVDESGAVWSHASKVGVNNGHVYAVGYEYADTVDPAIWKDGQKTVAYGLGDWPYVGFGITDLAFATAGPYSGHLYVLVYNYMGNEDDSAVYRIDPDNLGIGGWTHVTGGDGVHRVMGICAEGEDIYAAGWRLDIDWGQNPPVFQLFPCGYRNGDWFELPVPAGVSPSWIEGRSTHALGGRHYIAGYAEWDSTGRVVQWVDGAVVTGPGAVDLGPNDYDYAHAVPRAIFAQQ